MQNFFFFLTLKLAALEGIRRMINAVFFPLETGDVSEHAGVIFSVCAAVPLKKVYVCLSASVCWQCWTGAWWPAVRTP